MKQPAALNFLLIGSGISVLQLCESPRLLTPVNLIEGGGAATAGIKRNLSSFPNYLNIIEGDCQYQKEIICFSLEVSEYKRLQQESTHISV